MGSDFSTMILFNPNGSIMKVCRCDTPSYPKNTMPMMPRNL